MVIEDGVDIDGKWRDNRKDMKETAVYKAAMTNHVKAVKCLVQHGADFEIPRSDGNRPLHAAAAYGNHAVVEYLLSEGADFNAKNDANQTSWRVAFERFDDDGKKCLKLLQKAGAQVEEKESCTVM